MDKIAIEILNHEKEILEQRIRLSKHKVELIEKFLKDYPNTDTNGANCFLAWVNRGVYFYDDILKKMRGE